MLASKSGLKLFFAEVQVQFDKQELKLENCEIKELVFSTFGLSISIYVLLAMLIKRTHSHFCLSTAFCKKQHYFD